MDCNKIQIKQSEGVYYLDYDNSPLTGTSYELMPQSDEISGKYFGKPNPDSFTSKKDMPQEQVNTMNAMTRGDYYVVPIINQNKDHLNLIKLSLESLGELPLDGNRIVLETGPIVYRIHLLEALLTNFWGCDIPKIFGKDYDNFKHFDQDYIGALRQTMEEVHRVIMLSYDQFLGSSLYMETAPDKATYAGIYCKIENLLGKGCSSYLKKQINAQKFYEEMRWYLKDSGKTIYIGKQPYDFKRFSEEFNYHQMITNPRKVEKYNKLFCKKNPEFKLALIGSVKKSECGKQAFALVQKLSNTELARLKILSSCADGGRHFFLPYLYCTGNITKEQYTKIMLVLYRYSLNSTSNKKDNDHMQAIHEQTREHKKINDEITRILLEFESYNDISSSSNTLEKYIEKEECLTYEFKATFQTPLEPLISHDENGKKMWKMGNQSFHNKKDAINLLQDQCIKTIAAFLNTKGGQLIIGVHEKDNEKKFVGLNMESFLSRDRYEQHISQSIQNKIKNGAMFLADYIEIKTVTYKGDFFCVITCQPYYPGDSETGVMVTNKGEKCMPLRTGPRTDLITDIEEILKFTRNRAKKQKMS